MAGRFFMPRETVIRKLPDGREIQVAVKGVPVNLADAIYYEILSDEDFRTLAVERPADYGTRFLGATAAPTGTALTTSARGTVTHARAETDAASRTTTIIPADAPQPGTIQPNAASGIASPQTAAGGTGDGGQTSTGGQGTGERTASR